MTLALPNRRSVVAGGACLLLAAACSEGTGPEQTPSFRLVVEAASVAPETPEASVVYDSGELIVLGTTFTCNGATLGAAVELRGTQVTVRLREVVPEGCLDERTALSFRLTIEDLRSGRYRLRVLQVGTLGIERPVLIDQPVFIPADDASREGDLGLRASAEQLAVRGLLR